VLVRVDLLEGLSIDGVDGKALSTEINRTVEGTLKRFLTGQSLDAGWSASTTVTAPPVTESRKERDTAKPVASRVHGTISTSSYGDPIKETIGFGSDSIDLSSTTPAPILENNLSFGGSPANEPPPYDEPPPVLKPKSKADRLLGISTDVKSGMPINDNLQSTKQGGLFGSIGSLFSAKPGSGSSPSGGGLAVGFGMSSRNGTNHQPSPSKSHILGPIIDEGQEEQSDKKSSSKDKPKVKKGGSFSSSDGQSSKGASVTAVVANPQLVAEIAQEEVNYRQLMSNLITLGDVKVNLKKELKDWQIEFQNKFDREPSMEDKSVINDKFIAYKLVRVLHLLSLSMTVDRCWLLCGLLTGLPTNTASKGTS
jgi:hypothetical protein